MTPRPTMLLRATGLMLWLAWELSSVPAVACAACGCGDPTLTTMGNELPFAYRTRVAVELVRRTDSVGIPGVNQLSLTEYRSNVGLAWAPTSRLFLMATLPLLQRQVTYADLSEQRTQGLGDVELRSKWFLWQSRAGVARHLIAAIVGVKIPSTPLARDDNGQLLPAELQSGTGTVDPLVGLSYVVFRGAASIYLSANANVPVATRNGQRPSRSLRTTVAAQWGWTNVFATRLGLDARIDGPSFETGRAETDSSGKIIFVSPEALFSPTSDITGSVALRIPMWNGLRGHHTEAPILSASIVFDL